MTTAIIDAPPIIPRAAGSDAWRVPSRSNPGIHHVVRRDSNGDLSCDCTAASFGRDCHHRAAVRSMVTSEGETLSITVIDRPRGGDDAEMAAIEQVLVYGDLKQLSASQRVAYYNRVCESVGLNPFTRPFDYIMLSGKLTLYPKKDATDQLRKLNKVSIYDTRTEVVEGCVVVTAYARTPDGREDRDIGAVSLAGLKGESLSNGMMKAHTKAKRRVTLSICGLGWMDESEIESGAGASRTRVDLETGEIIGEAEARPAADRLPADAQRATPAEIGGKLDGSGTRYRRAIEAAIASGSLTADDVTGIMRDVFGKAHSRDLSVMERDVMIDVAEGRAAFRFDQHGKYTLRVDDQADPAPLAADEVEEVIFGGK